MNLWIGYVGSFLFVFLFFLSRCGLMVGGKLSMRSGDVRSCGSLTVGNRVMVTDGN